MKHILSCITVLLLLCCCSKQPNPEEVAAQTAKLYYENLFAGKYEEFVDAHYKTDSIPPVYREQLVANAKMYVAQQQEEHGGVRKILAVKGLADTAKHVGEAYIMLSFGDSISEEVVVPMVYHGGVWYLR